MKKIELSNEINPIILNQPNKDDIKEAQGVKNINTDILQASFITLIVGKPGCGKSHLIREFLLNKDLYNKKFSLVLFITPSKFEDKEITLDEKNHSPTLSVSWIKSTLVSFKEYTENKNIDHLPKNILIIFDDVISEIKKAEKDPEFLSLFYNRRHLLGDKFLISHLITTQKYSLCPAKVRSVVTSVIAFQLMKMDWRKLEDECIFDSYDRSYIRKFIQDIRESKFTFIYIRLDNSKIFYKFEKCINL